jgi:hypothetical protein
MSGLLFGAVAESPQNDHEDGSIAVISVTWAPNRPLHASSSNKDPRKKPLQSPMQAGPCLAWHRLA